MSLIRNTVSRDTLESNVHFERLSVSRKSGRCAISRQKFRANISARFFSQHDRFKIFELNDLRLKFDISFIYWLGYWS